MPVYIYVSPLSYHTVEVSFGKSSVHTQLIIYDVNKIGKNRIVVETLIQELVPVKPIY